MIALLVAVVSFGTAEASVVQSATAPCGSGAFDTLFFDRIALRCHETLRYLVMDGALALLWGGARKDQ